MRVCMRVCVRVRVCACTGVGLRVFVDGFTLLTTASEVDASQVSPPMHLEPATACDLTLGSRSPFIFVHVFICGICCYFPSDLS